MVQRNHLLSGGKLQLRHVEDDLRQRVRSGPHRVGQVDPGLPNQDPRSDPGGDSLHGPGHELLRGRIRDDLEQVRKTFFATSPIRTLKTACICLASQSHRWHG